MTIQPRRLPGPWRYGIALDLHTVSSTHLDSGGFVTQRTPLGEALYRLKYQADQTQINLIADAAAVQLRSWRVFRYLRALIPVPPSNLDRPFQPVFALAQTIGQRTGLAVPFDYCYKTQATPALKDIEDLALRQQALANTLAVRDLRYAGQSVVIFDDFYRSGATLQAVYNALVSQGQVGRVYALTITMTRTRQ
ncbi:MAG: hypothetical protein VKK80_17295 [Prochlorothrix sp.]|nr:hypothetical protein [Prochlorothrix sp.]